MLQNTRARDPLVTSQIAPKDKQKDDRIGYWGGKNHNLIIGVVAYSLVWSIVITRSAR